MRYVLFLFATLLLMANSDCRGGEMDEQVYLVVDKGSEVGSHFNIFHKDGFEVSTDYFITFQNVRTKHTFVHKFHSGEEYYGFVKGKKYKCRRFYEDNRY